MSDEPILGALRTRKEGQRYHSEMYILVDKQPQWRETHSFWDVYGRDDYTDNELRRVKTEPRLEANERLIEAIGGYMEIVTFNS